ncbi:MAG: hypothetical protein BGO01_13400 [Armatimonadetes bacterium 55-13]|nr:hypothetical protein [Armatimonadota bacterium]ODU52080.1 MAG: hypothetical protein ABT09_03030 [bacterium SCN 57-13]OJU61904.1 MAG: hypothetical protein BGO01_13400 [Armatimonadetes bacterium 55-13]
MNKAVETLKIVGLCILAAVIYGIVHDQITARVYLPYFTVFHPHVIDSEDPTVVALVWGGDRDVVGGIDFGIPVGL